ncbi:MAG: hypothetical protein ACLQKK_02980 [Rhodomicrobium sp.]
MKRVGWVFSLLLCGCASTQLTYNVLDVASSTSQLAREQVLHNLAQFIDNRTAIPAQVVFGQGSVSTENSVSSTLTDPLSKTLAVTNAIGGSTTHSVLATAADKSVGVTGGNTATQSWGVDTIGDPDQLRRLYDLYRFAVDGNDCPYAQLALLRDYPLTYSPNAEMATSATAPALSIDPNSMLGANCVLCGTNTASASPNSLQVCDGSDGAETVSAIEASPGTCEAGAMKPTGRRSRAVHRLELKGISKQLASSKIGNAAASLLNKNGKVCLTINRRLLPRDSLGRWLRWEALPGASRPSSIPAPDHQRDVYLGLYGHYALYVDGNQPDRFAEFVIFITGAATSALNPASNGAASGNGMQRASPGVVLTSGGGR